jgi:hypothetical protein
MAKNQTFENFLEAVDVSPSMFNVKASFPEKEFALINALNLPDDRVLNAIARNIGGKYLIQVVETTYSPNYARTKVKNDLEANGFDLGNIHVTLNTPKPGAMVTLQATSDQPPFDISIPAGSYYYAINSDVIDCNGFRFWEDFDATFDSHFEDRCSGNSYFTWYAKYRLL